MVFASVVLPHLTYVICISGVVSGNSFLLAITIYLGQFTTRAAQGNCVSKKSGK